MAARAAGKLFRLYGASASFSASADRSGSSAGVNSTRRARYSQAVVYALTSSAACPALSKYWCCLAWFSVRR